MRKLLIAMMLMPTLLMAVDNASIGNLKASGTITAGGTGEFAGNITVTNGDIILNGQSISNVIKTAQSSNVTYAASAGTAGTATNATFAATANNASNLTQYVLDFTNAVRAAQTNDGGGASAGWTNTFGSTSWTNTGVNVPLAGIGTNMISGAAHDLYDQSFYGVNLELNINCVFTNTSSVMTIVPFQLASTDPFALYRFASGTSNSIVLNRTGWYRVETGGSYWEATAAQNYQLLIRVEDSVRTYTNALCYLFGGYFSLNGTRMINVTNTPTTITLLYSTSANNMAHNYSALGYKQFWDIRKVARNE